MRLLIYQLALFLSSYAVLFLREMMSKGSSVPWPTVLKEMTGTDQLDSKPMLDYFKPLYDWLLKQNLTTTTWDCERYINNANNSVKAYDEIEDHNVHSVALCLKFSFSVFYFFIIFKLFY